MEMPIFVILHLAENLKESERLRTSAPVPPTLVLGTFGGQSANMPNSTPALSMFTEFGVEAPPLEERRRFPRIRVDVPARLKCLNPLTSTGPSIKARVIEISHGGMKIRANREFQHGGVVQVIVKDTFYMGTVRHCRRVEEGFDTSLKLTESIRSSLL